MHYSEKQKNEISNLKAAIFTAQLEINNFRNHLLSSKFHNDTTIQVSDVFRRLEEIESEMLKAAENGADW